jgi:hypothetical protein
MRRFTTEASETKMRNLFTMGARWQFALLVIAATAAGSAARGDTASSRGEAAIIDGDLPPLFERQTAIGTVSYTPGRGLLLGDRGPRIGGYASVNLVRPEGEPAHLGLDELSFIGVWDPLARLQLFAEIELEDVVGVDSDGNGGFDDAKLQIERLYGDLLVGDGLSVRVGKFLTPVGRWNEIHAPPLVWTTSRPLASELPFDDYVTGAMLFGTLFPARGSVNYGIFAQFGEQLDAIDQRVEADRSAGLRLEYTDPSGPSFGATYLAFRDGTVWRQLGGCDLAAWKGPFEIMSELIVEDVDGYSSPEWGLYLQTAYELMRPVYLIARYEYYSPVGDAEVNLIDLGIAYRPVPYALVKADYRIADRHTDYAPGGFFGSLAFLF